MRISWLRSWFPVNSADARCVFEVVVHAMTIITAMIAIAIIISMSVMPGCARASSRPSRGLPMLLPVPLPLPEPLPPLAQLVVPSAPRFPSTLFMPAPSVMY